jgi:hypothetical protein
MKGFSEFCRVPCAYSIRCFTFGGRDYYTYKLLPPTHITCLWFSSSTKPATSNMGQRENKIETKLSDK